MRHLYSHWRGRTRSKKLARKYSTKAVYIVPRRTMIEMYLSIVIFQTTATRAISMAIWKLKWFVTRRRCCGLTLRYKYTADVEYWFVKTMLPTVAIANYAHLLPRKGLVYILERSYQNNLLATISDHSVEEDKLLRSSRTIASAMMAYRFSRYKIFVRFHLDFHTRSTSMSIVIKHS